MSAKAIQTAKQGMEKAMTWLDDEFKKIRTGRANPAMLDSIRVEYYDQMTPIKQIATVTVPEPRQIVVKPFDPSSLKAIEKAIQASDLGITPSSEGQVIRLNVPPLSEERRKTLAAQVKDRAEQAKISVRNVRRDSLKDLETEVKAIKSVSEDEVKKWKDEIQNLTKAFETRIDEHAKKKSQEVMEIH